MGEMLREWRYRATLGRGILLAACVAGCVGDDQGSTSATAGPTSSGTSSTSGTTEAATTQGSAGTTADTTDGEEVPAICACLEEGGPVSDPWPFACGATSLCPFGSDDPAWVTCALGALRDRTPGLLSWDDATATDYTLLVLADGRGIARSWKPAGACYDVSAAMLGHLEAPEWYDACLALTDLAMRRACVTESFTGDELCAGSYTWQPGPECY